MVKLQSSSKCLLICSLQLLHVQLPPIQTPPSSTRPVQTFTASSSWPVKVRVCLSLLLPVLLRLQIFTPFRKVEESRNAANRSFMFCSRAAEVQQQHRKRSKRTNQVTIHCVMHLELRPLAIWRNFQRVQSSGRWWMEVVGGWTDGWMDLLATFTSRFAVSLHCFAK